MRIKRTHSTTRTYIEERKQLRRTRSLRKAGGRGLSLVCMQQWDWSRREFVKSSRGAGSGCGWSPALDLTAPAHLLFATPPTYVMTLRSRSHCGCVYVSGCRCGCVAGCPGNRESWCPVASRTGARHAAEAPEDPAEPSGEELRASSLPRLP